LPIFCRHFLQTCAGKEKVEFSINDNVQIEDARKHFGKKFILYFLQPFSTMFCVGGSGRGSRRKGAGNLFTAVI
jgi:hypothetical protein